MSYYDVIIAGSGAAGLSLAYQMAASPLRDQSMLIVDRDPKDRSDRRWGFWSQGPARFEHLVYRSWDQVEVVSDGFHRVYQISPYQYKLIRGIDYYRELRETLAALPQIDFLQGRVTEVSDTKDRKSAQVIVDEVPYGARWAFDSLLRPWGPEPGSGRYLDLQQHCKGWEIEAPTDCFDPQTVRLFDYRTPQKGSLRFFYILPFTRRRAFVRYTVSSAGVLQTHEYDRAIAEYLENTLKIPRYRIESIETGAVPLTDRPFPRRLGDHVMSIGAKGGRVKASTGDAFLRIQKDGAAIIESLINQGHPYQVQKSPARYRQFDRLMLHLMVRRGDQMKDLWIHLFQTHSIQQIFRILDEEASTADMLRLLPSLPTMPFLNALFRVKLPRKV